MSIGRIEMVDGVKKNVVYATLGGTGGIQVGNVQDLFIEEKSDNLTLKWKDPENVVFNGETIAEWAGTKVVRKEGSSPESVTDGTLVVDSVVRNQYAVDGLKDFDVSEDLQYNYALFPYTSKNIYTMSDQNRIEGFLKSTYDPILQNNTWGDISRASRQGVAKDWWKVGDKKDGYMIMGFDHDDLSNGGGKAGVTFLLQDSGKFEKGKYSSNINFVDYANSEIQDVLNRLYEALPEEIKKNIKSVNKKYQPTSTIGSGNYLSVSQKLFLFSCYEVTGSPANDSPSGERYEYRGKYNNDAAWTRTSRGSYDQFAFYGNASYTYRRNEMTYTGYGYGFCI